MVVSTVCVEGQAVSSDVPRNLHVVTEAPPHPVLLVSSHYSQLSILDGAQVGRQVLGSVGVRQGSVCAIIVAKGKAVVGAFDDADQDSAASLAMSTVLLLLWGPLGDLGRLPTIDHPVCDLFAGGRGGLVGGSQFQLHT